jgi:hypothetical protein
MGATDILVGIILTILAMASFQEGGAFILSGIASSLVLLWLLFNSYKEDAKNHTA